MVRQLVKKKNNNAPSGGLHASGRLLRASDRRHAGGTRRSLDIPTRSRSGRADDGTVTRTRRRKSLPAIRHCLFFNTGFRKKKSEM